MLCIFPILHPLTFNLPKLRHKTNENSVWCTNLSVLKIIPKTRKNSTQQKVFRTGSNLAVYSVKWWFTVYAVQFRERDIGMINLLNTNLLFF